MLEPLRVAVAQPAVIHGDLLATAAAHADAVRQAAARLVVFPELSLTGYVLDAPTVALDDPAWDELVAACAEHGTTALVGAPVAGDDGEGRAIGVVAVDGSGVRVIYRKAHLYGEELDAFTAGPGATVVEVGGWRVGLAVCRDTGIAEHTAATAALGVDLYAAGVVDLPEALTVIRSRAVTNARACGAPVAVASAAGPVGERFGFPQTAGGSAVHDADGALLAAAGAEPGELVVVDLEPPRG
ncbi:Predicted amidohydrolase [Quadrisphaera granulorum]|uniref:Putative amidohydrolase n=1 Tax=Quadrisphaera granulorum TaxID=317664 RepID=A0A315ZX83_9ACTN|nr:nitrilase-related carbon-nitrogen hydrolase [Quadrisphaera granulorum]PWJ50256.1 putative amidohydrolase [Quadrisphaera granulorum]SZE98022.1 Predicted amidohydrolase [Quadrisphaera granulorum]